MKCHGIWVKNCAFLLIIAILGGCFLSCGGKGEDERETDEKNTDSAIVIASGGQTQYTLVRPSKRCWKKPFRFMRASGTPAVLWWK